MIIGDWSAAAPTFHAWNGRQELTSQQQQLVVCAGAAHTDRRSPHPRVRAAVKPKRPSPAGRAAPRSGSAETLLAFNRLSPRRPVRARHPGMGWPLHCTPTVPVGPGRRARSCGFCVTAPRSLAGLGRWVPCWCRAAGRLAPAVLSVSGRRPRRPSAGDRWVLGRCPPRACTAASRFGPAVVWRGVPRAPGSGWGRVGVWLVPGWNWNGMEGEASNPKLGISRRRAGWLGFLPPPQAALEITHKLSHPCAEHAWRGVEWNPTEASCISLVLVRCLLLLLLGHTHTLPGFAFLTLMLSGPN
jgi:hypothetical protein